MAKSLTILQQRFADIYFRMKEPNQTQAYIKAGYKAKGKTAEQAACRLARNVKVRAYLNKLGAAVTKKTEINGAKVIAELAKVAFSNIQDYLTVCEDGEVFLKNFDDIEREKLAVVEYIKTSTTKNKDDSREYTTTQFKLHSKLNALEQLGKHFGIYGKDNEQSRSIQDTKTLTLKEMKERIAKAEAAGTGLDNRSIEGGNGNSN